MLTILGIMLASASGISALQTVSLPLPNAPSETLALHCVAPQRATDEAVLFIHGASFPTLLAAGFEFQGRDSWMDYMATKGYLACGLDFLGFGGSSRPPAMAASAEGAAPIDRAAEAATQIAVAVAYLHGQRGMKRLHLVAHSWGTIPAGLYAAAYPGTLASLTLFGPVVPVEGAVEKTVTYSWWTVSANERLEQLGYKALLPPELHLLDPALAPKWAEEFAASDPGTHRSVDAPLRIPSGPVADISAAKAGDYPYSQAKVSVPVFVVYGDFDNVVDDAGAVPFLARFTGSPLKWRLRIDHGTHVMHLEKNRTSLYGSVAAFIATVDAASGG